MTRKLGFTALIKAVYTELKADSLTKSYNIYNEVPDNASFPYIVIGTPLGGRSASFGNKDVEAEENVIIINVWSSYRGDKEASDIMNNVTQALTNATLSITGYGSPFLFLLDYADILKDDAEPARILRHGLLRFIAHMAPS